MPIRSYTRSTDDYRKSCGENILCGIDISVMVSATSWAIPFPNIKRQFIDNVTAVSTTLRAGEPSVNLNQRPTVPLALILQLTNQLRPTGISNCLSKFMVLHHALHCQVFDGNRLVFTYQSSCQLVKEIFSSVGNSCLNSSHFPSCFLSIIRVFNFARIPCKAVLEGRGFYP